MTPIGGEPARRLDRWWKAFLPARGGADAETDPRARVLVCGALLAGLATLSLVAQLAGERAPIHLWAVVVIGLLGTLLVLALVRADRVEAAGYAFPAVAIGIGTLMEIAEGASSPRSNVLIVGVIMAGMLVRPAAALAFTGAAVGAVVLARATERLGWVAPQAPEPEGIWLTSIRLIVLSGLLVTLLTAMLRRSIDRLRERERELSESLVALERARSVEDAARARLQQAERVESLGRFAGGVAHDFNNLLTVILGNASLALDGHADRDLLEEIATAADRGAVLTRQLLALTRRQPMPAKPIDLHETLRNLRPLLARLLGDSIAIELDLGARDATVLADPGRVDQVLVNLAMNALDAMPGGGTLTFETSEGGGPGRFRLAVRDSGVGMTPEVQERVFEPFFSTRTAGTGLGLSIVREAVAEMGGSVSVESAPGAGSAFLLELPRAADQPAGALPARAAHAPRAGSAALVVDDDPTVRETVRHMLERLGYRVLAVSDAEEVRSALAAGDAPLAFCLIDVVLEQGSGAEAAAAVLEVQPDCPVVTMSGFSAKELAQRGFEAQAGFLTKPFTMEELRRAVEARVGARA